MFNQVNGTDAEPIQQRKLFVGSLNFETTSEGLKSYFSKFGDVTGKQKKSYKKLS